MSTPSPIRVLLGPQSPEPNIAGAVASAGIPDGPLAVISAGWRETEGDIDELADLLDRPVEDLYLYGREEGLLAQNEELQAAARLRQERLIELQILYRQRLKQLSIAARQMMSAAGDTETVEAEQRHAIAQLRALDRHQLHRSESIWRVFNESFRADVHPLLKPHVAEIQAIIDRTAAVVITGGNVVVLLNRMRLFGLDRLLNDQHIVAWSAGAMVLAERIVLFHDNAPEGRRDAELLGSGCGIVPGYVFLPDTKRRLRENNHKRVGLLSRRFAPDQCIALDNGAVLEFAGKDATRATATRKLQHDGRLARLPT